MQYTSNIFCFQNIYMEEQKLFLETVTPLIRNTQSTIGSQPWQQAVDLTVPKESTSIQSTSEETVEYKDFSYSYCWARGEF